MVSPEPSRRTLTDVAEVVLARVPELADAFIRQVRGVAGYSPTVLTDDDLRASAERSLELLITRIARTALSRELSRSSWEIGRARLDAGIPLESLMQAVRLDFRLVWGALAEEIRPSEMPLLINSASEVWEVVERHANDILIAYQDRAAERSRAQADERRRWFARLISTENHSAEALRQTARGLGVGAEREFVIVSAMRPRLEPFVRQLRGSGISHFHHLLSDSEAVLIQLPRAGELDLKDWLDGVPCVLSRGFVGLHLVPHHLRLTVSVLEAHGDLTGPTQVGESWLQLAAAGLGEFRADLEDDVLGDFRRGANAEATRVLNTVSLFLTVGNVADVADRLFCHRNTVSNHLSRFRDATGYDPTNPAHACLIALALRA